LSSKGKSDKGVACSEEMKAYFQALHSESRRCYDVAEKARARGFDPEIFVEIPPAENLSSRVEKLVGPEGITKVIEDFLKKEKDGNRSMVAIKVAKYIVNELEFEDREEALDQAVRTGLAIVTEGVLVAPLEGVSEVNIKRNDSGSEYLRLSFAGPIRSAGGTGQAVGCLIADVVRREMNLEPFEVRNDEVERLKEEFQLRKASQYSPSDAEIENIARNCPICLDGDGSEPSEVAGYRNLDRVSTNQVRGGLCLVMAEGLCQKAKKIKKLVDNLHLEGWDFITAMIKDDDKAKDGEEKNEPKDMYNYTPKPKLKFLEKVIAGRPVIAYPSAHGAFRLRYGRGRTCGLAAIAIHPATMAVLNDFLAIGTQIKIEFPGKAGGVTPCDTIEGPIVEYFSGDLVKFHKAEDVVAEKKRIKRIVDLGEVLIPFGEFAENNHVLLPPGFAPEWWYQLLEAKLPQDCTPKKSARSLYNADVIDSFTLSRALDVPLNPRYNLFYHDMSPETLGYLAEYLCERGEFRIPGDGDYMVRLSDLVDLLEGHEPDRDLTAENISSMISSERSKGVLVIPIEKDRPYMTIKESLCRLGALHTVDKGNLLIHEDYSLALVLGLGLRVDEKGRIFKSKVLDQEHSRFLRDISDVTVMDNVLGKGPVRYEDEKEYLEKRNDRYWGNSIRFVSDVSGITIYPRSPSRMGCRMARPEKASERKMSPAVHCLFPLSASGGSQRSMKKAVEEKRFDVDIGYRECPKCHNLSHRYFCEKCEAHTEVTDDFKVKTRNVYFYKDFGEARKKVNVFEVPMVKGVKGMMSKHKTPEPLEKGLLRAKHGISIFKDGTARFDMVDLPVTHFKPYEINTPVEKLIKLGYTKDMYGEPLKRDDQILELKVQDIICPENCLRYLYKVSRFLDDMLFRFYGLDPYYNLVGFSDLIGHLTVGLAPHTSGGVLSRIIGYCNVRAGYAHPFYHAAKRRNCDGDEDCVMLLLDGLINFSRTYLPATLGGQMDAPLVLSVKIDPAEIDSEAHNIDCRSVYPVEFYEAAMVQEKAKQLEDMMDLVGGRLGTPAQYEGFGFTHDTVDLAGATTMTAYTKIKSMKSKIDEQLKLARIIRAVEAPLVAAKVIDSHFMPDMIGNMKAFSRQKFRCTNCGKKFRRPPIRKECPSCGNETLSLTVYKGMVEKYVNLAKQISERYDLPIYTRKRIQLIEEAINSLFNNDKVEQKGLWDFC